MVFVVTGLLFYPLQIVCSGIYPSYSTKQFYQRKEKVIPMKKFSSKVRSLLFGGAIAIITLISVLFAYASCLHDKTDTGKSSSVTEVTTCTTTTTTSTTSNSTTSSTTTSTTTTTTTAEIVLMTVPIATSQTIAVAIETQPVYVPPATEAYVEPVQNFGYSESDAILMAQVINKEASASYDGKVAVASVILNRSNYYGQSISDVVYAPNQFSVVNNLGSYTDADYQAAVQVLTSGSVNNAYYFDGCHPDGLNHFRDINNNYIGAW